MSKLKDLCPEVELCLFALSIVICRANIKSDSFTTIEDVQSHLNKCVFGLTPELMVDLSVLRHAIGMFKNVLQKKFLWEIDVTRKRRLSPEVEKKDSGLGSLAPLYADYNVAYLLLKVKRIEHMQNCQDLIEKSDSTYSCC